MKKILMSLFISVITISTLWAEGRVTIEQDCWDPDANRSISNVPSVTIQNDMLYITTEKQLENISIEIQDLSGNTVMQQANIMIPSDNAHSLYIDNLPEGDYLFILTQGEKYIIYSLIK